MTARFAIAAVLPIVSATAFVVSATRAVADAGDAERGRLVFAAAGGCTCHTDYTEDAEEAGEDGNGPPWLAGGRPVSTPFGVYYSTNITPDDETGIGAFDEADFLRAMQEGHGPDGRLYFPVFPYTSFTRMTEGDLRDLHAYLRSVPAIRRENRPHDVPPPFGWRWAIAVWNALNFEPGRFVPDPSQSDEWNRGAYLVNGPSHCGECHTPRGLTGGLDRSRFLAGSAEGPEGELAPNITPDDETGIGRWSIPDIDWYLETGLKPDGDDTQGLMAEVIEHGFSNLPRADRRAIATYLKSIPPVRNVVRAEP